MNVKVQAKRTLKQLLVQPQVNRIVQTLMSPDLVRKLVPANTLVRLPVVGDVQVKLPDGRYFIMRTDGDDAIATLLFHQRDMLAFEPNTLNVFFLLLQQAKTFLDVGANTGIYALAAAVDDPRRQVYAFEPFSAIYAYLVRNIEVNQLANLYPFQIAVTDHGGTIPFYIPTSTVVFPSTASTSDHMAANSHRINVPSTTLDQFLAEHQVSRVDLVKIDTESTEPAVLRGAQNMLTHHRPFIICEVLPVGVEAGLHSALAPVNYVYFWIAGNRLICQEQIVGDPTYAHMNYLFVPRERLQDLPAQLLAG